jgi:hypothetical protein
MKNTQLPVPPIESPVPTYRVTGLLVHTEPSVADEPYDRYIMTSNINQTLFNLRKNNVTNLSYSIID